MSYLVSQGTRELGIRLALGAAPNDVLVLVVRQGMVVTATGLVLGFVGSFVLTRYMSTLLFGVGANDPATFAAIAVTLTFVAFVACYVPGRRAARIDPLVSLRAE
jgi:ABC-type antimicrobial peptide transport system permease subunit